MKTDKNSRTKTTSGTDTHPEQAIPDTNHGSPLPKTQERISYEKWLVKYRPIKNPLDANAPFDGCMFGTFGKDLEFVRKQPINKIWTLVDCNGKNFVVEGLHILNRLGFFIAQVEFSPTCEPTQTVWAVPAIKHEVTNKAYTVKIYWARFDEGYHTVRAKSKVEALEKAIAIKSSNLDDDCFYPIESVIQIVSVELEKEEPSHE